MRGPDHHPGILKRYIQERLSDYLKFLSSFTFLAAFLVILIPFLTGTGGNIFVAILSLVLLRRTLGFFVSVPKNATKLNKNQHEINALIFPEIQMVKLENKERLAVRDLFYKAARLKMVQDELHRIMPLRGPIQVHWMDSTASGVYMFAITLEKEESGSKVCYQQQAFPQNSIRYFNNEDFLFRQIDRKGFHAPGLIASFLHEPFACRIVEYGLGKPVADREWRKVHDILLEHYCAFRPPDNLMKAFQSSHLLLHQRLSEDFVSRVEVAVDTAEEENALNQFKECLINIRAFLKAMPLYIHNPEMQKNNVVQADDDRVYVMTWGRWTLEPVGSVLPLDRNNMERMLQLFNETRKDTPVGLDASSLYFVFHCQKLEKELNRGAYKAALSTIHNLLLTPAFESKAI